VSCSKEGFGTESIVVKSATKGMAAGNIIFGGVIGGGVDVATGAAYDYPNLITNPLSCKKAASK
jgi:phosphoketolase